MLKSASLILICGTFLAVGWYISPILKPFPPLSGSYQVGLQTLQVADQTRTEQFSQNTYEKRSLMLHILYPATNGADINKAPYLGSKIPTFQKTFSALYNIPEKITKILFHNIKTNLYQNAQPASSQDTYPIILFSHGLLGLPSDMYLAYLQDLASHGFIVVGIDHPYFNVITQYPDGKVVSAQALTSQFQKMSQTEQKAFQNRAIDIYKADVSFVIDELARINNDSTNIFYHHLDLDRIAVMGHSAGGTAAIEVCRSDNRCKAVINLDGWYDQAIGYEPLKQPLLLLFGAKSVEVTEPTPEYLARKQLTRDQYYDRERKIDEHKKALCQSPQCQIIVIPEAAHDDFSDMILFKWPLRALNASDSYKTIATINAYILHFLDRQLKN